MKTLRSGVGLLVALVAAGALRGQSWVEVTPPPQDSVHIAYDIARSRTVMLGTWQWDGAAWSKLVTANAPPTAAPMAYDAARAVTVMFHGTQTWEFDGMNWLLRTTATVPPPPQTAHALAYDVARFRTVMFTGSQTWEYDGIDWTFVPTPASPPPRSYHVLTYDWVRGRTVLFGGTGNTSFLNDTWEYDGVTWSSVATVHRPPAYAGVLSYDIVRARIVWCGGAAGTETWEYDGTDWIQRGGSAAIPVGGTRSLAYDLQRQRMVLVVSSPVVATLSMIPFLETWEYDGSAWDRVSGPPPGRFGHAMAYDSARERTVLFGGVCWILSFSYSVPSSIDQRQDTWELGGDSWRQVTTAGAPPARLGHKLAFDSDRQRTVLFGGWDMVTNRVFGDTWSYDGTTWLAANPAQAPSARTGHAMAYDSRRRRTVLFGGGASATTLADTWEYDGTNWTQVSTTGAPSPRSGHAMAYDSARGRIVLFGGWSAGTQSSVADTWECDGVAWMPITAAHAPAARSGHSMAFDALHGRVRLFGANWAGATATPNDTWEFDGSDWQIVTVPAPAPTLGSRVMVHDSARDRTVLFGGTTGSRFVYIMAASAHLTTDQPAHWELQPAAAPDWTHHGQGCPGSAGIPLLDRVGNAVPALGTTFPLRLSSLPQPSGVAYLALGFGVGAWNGVALPQSLMLLNMPACDLWLAPEPGLGPVLLHQNGTANYALVLPAVPALAGVHVAAQALVFDPQAPGGFGAVSNAGIATLH